MKLPMSTNVCHCVPINETKDLHAQNCLTLLSDNLMETSPHGVFSESTESCFCYSVGTGKLPHPSSLPKWILLSLT